MTSSRPTPFARPEIQANAVTHAKMADDSVDTPELQDGAVTVAKMDSGTATDGHVATADGSGGVAYEAVTTGGAGSSTFVDLTDTPAAITASECVQGNAAGDALVFATCATGGGGTTVTANPGSGATDLTTVTIGTTDYTIAPSATAVTAFECVMTDVAAATYSAVTNILECDGTPTINEGMFVVEDASGTDTTDRVVIQAAGFYQLIVSLHIDSIASTLRTVAIVSFQLERGGTDTVLADQGTEYVRDSVEAASVYHTSLVELEVDDRIGVVLQSEAGSASIGIDGSKSYFAIIRAGGPEGPRGPAGTGSDIDSVDVSYAPDVRVWELTIEQTGGGATFVESTTIPIATQATFGLIEMANGLEVQAGSAINRAIGPSTIQFLDPDQMASGSSADGDVPTADGAGRITWEAQSGGGGTGVSVDGVDVQYVTNSRAVFVQVQQDDGNDFSDMANLPLATATVPGLITTSTDAQATAGTSAAHAITPDNVDALLVASMSSGSATNDHVPRADGSGGIDWEAASTRALATSDPADVAAEAETGSGTHAAHGNHVHALAISDTLEFSASDELSVSITEVIEHLSQQIRYFTSDGADYSTGGSAAGQVYTTNQYPKNLFKVQAQIRPSTGSIYRAGVYEVDDDNEITAVLGESEDSAELAQNQTHLIKFDLSVVGGTDLGIPLDGDERVAILIRRVGDGDTADTHVRAGSEAASSPAVSYADARNDFVLVNHVIYRHEDPAIGNNTHSHGTSIRGNLRLYYSVTIDHGSLIGSGRVNAAHIDSGSALATQFLRADGSQGALWAVPAGGSGDRLPPLRRCNEPECCRGAGRR